MWQNKMAAIHSIIWLAVGIASMVHTIDAGATFQIKLIKYSNPSGREMDGDCCDSLIWCGQKCDHDITFCVDKYEEAPNDHNRNNMYYCTEYPAKSTGRIANSLVINFAGSTRIGSVVNPIVIKKTVWPGRMVLKVYVRDNDSWKAPGHKYSDVDKFVTTLSPHKYPSARVARWSSDYNIVGVRGGAKTSLLFRLKLYCNDNYYGPGCNVFCVGQDNPMTGHYTCDPDTGARVCLPGWEDPVIRCKLLGNDCLGKNCNNGTCVDGNRIYTCKCPPGITGQHCEVDVDECASSPCVRANTHQCLNVKSSFACHCKPGFVGATCQFDICDDDLGCQNGGTCVGTGECLCAPGYVGLHCEIVVCDTKTCDNGGRCNHGMCYCPRKYTGDRCERKVDLCEDIVCPNGVCKDGICINPCNSRPCQNRGTCYFSLDATTYHCKCLPGYTGRNCSTPVETEQTDETDKTPVSVEDKCQTVVCHNSGTCQAGICLCPPGFTGTDCLGIINYCLDITCENGGTCYSNPAGFVCLCKDQYYGTKCESLTDANVCKDVACENGGRCVAGTCLCIPGFSGTYCTQRAGCNIRPCKNGGSCYRSDYSFTCVCTPDWQGYNCDQKAAANVQENPKTEKSTQADGFEYWVYIVIGVGIVFLILIILVVALLVTKKRRKQKEKAPETMNNVNNTRESFDNPTFHQNGVYENMDDAPDQVGYNYSTQNDINLNIVPRDKHVYSKQLPSKGKRPPIPERSQSYDGTQPLKGVSNNHSTSSGRRGSVPSSIEGSSVYNATAGTASGYTYAKVDKNSKKGTKSRELKTPKHLEDRYQSMKEATMQNSLKG